MRNNESLDVYYVGFQASVANGEVFLSIGMPTYNEGPTIRRAVCQVLTTSYPRRTELIVVDDGSSDETSEQLHGLSANLLFDSAVTDMHTCPKLLPLALLREMRLVELGFGMDTEITGNVLKLGYRPIEVPVAYYVRSHLQGKKINWRDGVQCLRILSRVRMVNLLLEKDDLTRSRTSEDSRSLIDTLPSNAD